jgi:hypothetical protein
MARPYHPPAPFTAPVSGNIEQRLAAIADAINRKLDAGGSNTAFPFIGMQSPNGTTWRLSVDDTGAVVTVMVPR